MSKRRVVPSSSLFMDPEVIEIPPPIPRSTRAKRKEVVSKEVICLDNDDAFVDVMILDEEVETKKKGKALMRSSAVETNYQSKNPVNGTPDLGDKIGPSGKPLTGHELDLDSDLFHDIYSSNYFYDTANVDDYSLLQAKFDSIDIPAGVEAPIPWFSDSVHIEKNFFQKNSGLEIQGNDQSVSFPSLVPMHIKKKAIPASSSSQNPVDASSHPGGANSSSPIVCSQHTNSNKGRKHSFGHFPVASQDGGTRNHFGVKPSDTTTLQHGAEPLIWGQYPSIHLQSPVDYSPYLPYPSQPKPVHLPPPAMASHPNFSTYSKYACSHNDTDNPCISPQELETIRKQNIVNEEEILRKFQLFKQFDTVEDFSDHHYSSGGSSKKRVTASSSHDLPKKLSKRIQEEWRMLQKDLPDTIFVRVCETRMDLLRAVIIGAEGTPYHDGLFFFDICFPDTYPRVPPLVHYHSRGLRLNPNLYSCGKVCLSLLNTWAGNGNEKWIPDMSTMLQVLVSIQALILNQKPYFNEPGYERSSGTARGEKLAHEYNERTVLLSLKTMLYTMRNPPKHFEDFVAGHFYNRAHDILLACKAYKDGAQVGSILKGGVQDVDEGGHSCSQSFKENVAASTNILAKEFTQLGVRDCEKFITNLSNGRSSMPEPAI